jgi:hypothetical protein
MESRATRGNFETTVKKVEEVGAPGQQRRPSGSGLGPLSAGTYVGRPAAAAANVAASSVCLPDFRGKDTGNCPRRCSHRRRSASWALRGRCVCAVRGAAEPTTVCAVPTTAAARTAPSRRRWLARDGARLRGLRPQGVESSGRDLPLDQTLWAHRRAPGWRHRTARWACCRRPPRSPSAAGALLAPQAPSLLQDAR